MARIVIVAQEAEVFEFLGFVLDRERHKVKLIRNSAIICEKLQVLNPQLIILESGGLIENVEELCARIRSWRKFRSVRILVIAPVSESRVVARPCRGADAALGRPLHPRAVLEQVKKLLKGKVLFQPGGEIAVEDLVLDPASYRVTRAGRVLSLTVREFRLLCFLVSHPNTLWSRQQLIAAIWPKPRVTPRTIDVFIRRLRLKIEDDPDNPVRLCSVRGEGYSFELRGEPSALACDEGELSRDQDDANKTAMRS